MLMLMHGSIMYFVNQENSPVKITYTTASAILFYSVLTVLCTVNH